MWLQKVSRIFSMILLASSFEYVIFTQHTSWNWIDWILLFVVPIITIISVCGETNYKYNIYDFDKIFKEGYWIFRFINAIVCICLYWKLHEENSTLLISQVFQDRMLVVIGLFTILNFYYWLLGLLSIFCSLYIWNNCNIDSLWLYIISIGTLVLGIILMFIVAIKINKFRWEQCYAREKEEELKRIEEELERIKEENKILINELLEKQKSEQKWWKFWN